MLSFRIFFHGMQRKHLPRFHSLNWRILRQLGVLPLQWLKEGDHASCFLQAKGPTLQAVVLKLILHDTT